MITVSELASMEARCNAATPGPWFHVPCPDGWNDGVFTTPDPILGDSTTVFSTLEGNMGMVSEEDGRFIAHARADVPALIAEVRRFRAALQAVADCAHASGCTRTWEIAREALGEEGGA